MADDVANLGIKVDSSGVVKATRSLNKLDKQSHKNDRSNEKLKKSFIGLKTAAAAVAGSLVLKHFVSTAAAFETMKISLETVTGSAEKANIAFEGIKEFAANTPFSVEEVTQSFIKLKALGIAPTEANLRSFGNTSSAMGKSLNQMIEAVADAATGEFERLKEFGIKASKEGDRATFTFKGVTTTVKNSSEEITKYLQSIGENEFGGAMAKQMDTVNGAFSNAGDAVDNLADKLGKAGLNSVVKEVALSFAGLVNNIADLFDSGDSVRNLEKQIDFVRNSIFTLQEVVEDAQEGGFFTNLFGSSDVALKQIRSLEQQLDALMSKLDAAEGKTPKNGIEEAGAGGEAKRAAEIAAEEEKHRTLAETAAQWQEFNKAQALQAKMTEDEELLELDKLAQEGILASRAQMDVDALMAANQAQKDRNEAIASTFGALATLTASSSKKMFKMGKAASIASAIINTHEAITETMSATPYPWNIPLAVAQGAAGLVQVQNIKSQQFSGQAHEGMDFVKNTGSYQLERGEMVVDKGTSAAVRDNLVGGSNVITFAPVVQAFDAEEVGQKNEKLFVGMRNMFVDWMNEEGLSFS